MAKRSTPFYLVAAIAAIVIIGSTLDILDAVFGTRMVAYSGSWLAVAVALLFIAYLVQAYKIWKKK
ncbi:hypothetical protein [Anaeroselena agilis]|uniref:Uncharacterized protein n=1 Tax=Anaeroselena agilis TaxID=3063788 RepID=A0ABU3NVM0_9FIRM|nr:hypothetical protein [Selenomonadales bacterium 4137-cl]